MGSERLGYVIKAQEWEKRDICGGFWGCHKAHSQVSQGWLLEYFPASWSREERRSGRSYFLTTGPHLFSPFPKVKLCLERAWGQPCINTQKYVGSPNRATQKALIGHLGQLWCKYSCHGWFCISSLMCHCGIEKWCTWSAPMSRWALAAAHPCIHTWGTTTGI